MKLFSRTKRTLFSLVFFSIFFSLSLIFVSESMALNNASLNGTYVYGQLGSAFQGADVNGGFGAIDSERAYPGEFTFDGLGGCTDSFTKNVINRTIDETPSHSNTFTTTFSSTFYPPSPCAYNLTADGTLTMTFDPGGPGETTVTGTVSANGSMIIIGGVHIEPGIGFYNMVIVAAKKGTGLTNASLNGTYALYYKGSSFNRPDVNSGYGMIDEVGINEATFTLDGAGNCTGIEGYNSIQRVIDETILFSNTFITTYLPGSPAPLPPCIYSVTTDGSLTFTLDPGTPYEETITVGMVSADGRTIIEAEADAVGHSAGLNVSVKKGTAINNASVRGSYAWVSQGSAFVDSDVNGGFGMTDIERVETGYITFDGAGGCTSYPSPEDAILRTIGETGTFSNTFTTLHTQTAFGPQFCVYDVSPDGTMTLTFDPGGPDEEVNSVQIREDGNFVISPNVSTDPNYMGVSLTMLVRSARPAADIKVNGSDGAITITRAEALNVTVSLEPGNFSGTNADWWVLADTPFGWYRYNVGTDSWVPGQAVTYQGPVRDLPAREVLNMTGLPAGVYTLSFEVDLTRNGVKDGPIYSDSVEVTVTP